MWADNEELNENGDAVKLYLPVQGTNRRPFGHRKQSYIGGTPSSPEKGPAVSIPICKCNEPMFLFSELHFERPAKIKKNDGSAEEEEAISCTTVRVFGCPQSECFKELKFINGFAVGGQGVMCCTRVETIEKKEDRQQAMMRNAIQAPVKSSWYDDDTNGKKTTAAATKEKEENEWDTGNLADLSSLDKELAKMEEKLDNKESATQKQQQPPPKSNYNKGNKKSSSTSNNNNNDKSKNRCFPRHMLTEINEPIIEDRQQQEMMEEDDVGLVASDDKVRNMLARYMAEEEDENILAALRGTKIGAGIAEEDERLAVEERKLLSFQDRVKRSPRQVIRYAHGGEPLWSIPSHDAKTNEPLWKCPPDHVFEFQLMPSILHTLDVDKFATPEKDDAGRAGIGNLLSSGMNWGAVAVFTSTDPDSGDETREDILVIQESVDGTPATMTRDDDNRGDGDQVERPYYAGDWNATMAVVEDLDDDDEFEPLS